MHSFSSVELLLRLAALPQDPNVLILEDEMQWFVETDFVSNLLGQLCSDADSTSRGNAAAALAGLLHQVSPFSPGKVSEAVFSEAAVLQLLNKILEPGVMLSQPALSVLSELLKRCQKPEGEEPEATLVPQVIRPVVERLDDLVGLITALPGSSQPRLSTTIGTQEAQFGAARIQGIHALNALMRTGSDNVGAAAASCGLITRCLDLFPEFRWQSILHNAVLDMVKAVYSSPAMRALHADSGIAQKAAVLYTQGDSHGTKHRPSYLAQLLQVGVTIRNTATQDADLAAAIQADPVVKEWIEGAVAQSELLEQRRQATRPQTPPIPDNGSDDGDPIEVMHNGGYMGHDSGLAGSGGGEESWAAFDDDVR